MFTWLSIMTCRAFFLGASLSLAIHCAVAGPTSVGKSGHGKSYGKDEDEPAIEIHVEIPEVSRNRVGVLANGGLGISAEILSNAFTKKSPTTPITQSEDADFALGGEIFYERILSADPSAQDLWGIRVGVGYSQVEMEDRHSGFDEFGQFFTLEHDFDADLIHANVGPFFERRFTDRFYGQASVGLTAAYIDADLETTHSAGFSAYEGDDEFLFGAYAQVALGYQVSSNWSLMAGIRYQYLDTFEIDNGISEVDLDFDSSYVVFAGVRWNF
jgi:outer membrane receptor protein involved in Fe transport